MRLLVTGASGFVGRRLVAEAERRWPWAAITALAGPREPGGIDITDAAQMGAAMQVACPTHVAHLAAIAGLGDAAQDPHAAFAVNLGGTLNLVEALKAFAPAARLLHVSSAEVYGRSLSEAAGSPVGESAPLQPLNTYAASKAAADLLVQAEAAQGLQAVIVRPFNHIGAGQSEAFVVPAFAAQIARAEAGVQPPVIEVGRLEDGRDFLSVADVVEAYLLLLEAGSLSNAVYNVASGAAVTIGEVLRRLTALSCVPLEVRTDSRRLRPGPPAIYVGDAAKLREAVGWRQECALDAALSEVLAEQRRLVAVGE